MYTEEEINLITLSSFTQLAYAVKKSMLSSFNSFVPDFSKYDGKLIKSPPRGVYNKIRDNFSDSSYRRALLEKLSAKGIVCATYVSEIYPDFLRHIPDPPIVLYCKGDVSLLKSRCFSVVGSRRSSQKVLAYCRKICGELAAAFTVVSGIAEGADAAALEGALSCGRAVSVLANGFDHVYPAVNGDLIKRVERNGLLVTEYSPEETARPFHFPFRNRIIAGLSMGTLVVSAGSKSGALITADYAAEFGRDVFAFPYSPGCPEGSGCNALIKNGAYLVENILDIFQTYGLDFKKPVAVSLTQAEREVYEAIRDCGDAFIAVIAEKLGKAPHQLIAPISSLEIKGLVVSLGGNRYAAVGSAQ